MLIFARCIICCVILKDIFHQGWVALSMTLKSNCVATVLCLSQDNLLSYRAPLQLSRLKIATKGLLLSIIESKRSVLFCALNVPVLIELRFLEGGVWKGQENSKIKVSLIGGNPNSLRYLINMVTQTIEGFKLYHQIVVQVPLARGLCPIFC